MDFIQHIQKFRRFHSPKGCILFQVFLISYSIAQIGNRCVRWHAGHHSNLCFQFEDPIHHPVFILQFRSKFIKRDLRCIQKCPGHIPVGSIDDFQKVTSWPASLCNPQISKYIPADKMTVNIRNHVLHLKWDIEIHQFLYQTAGTSNGTEKHSNLFLRNSLPDSRLNFSYDMKILVVAVCKLTHQHRIYCRSIGPDVLFKSCLIHPNYFPSCSHNISVASEIDIQ